MKKSQLRKIIRESIKQLMNEQSTNGIIASVAGCTGMWVSTNDINGTSCQNWGNAAGQCGRCVPSNAQPGDMFRYTQFGNNPNASFFIVELAQDASNNYYPCTLPSTLSSFSGSCDNCCGTNPPLTPGVWPQWGSTPPPTPTGVCWNACGNPTPCTAYGCTDPTATNYNSTILPNCDQGCVWLGCTDSTASNYDPVATIDDGSCILGNAGCPTCDPSAWPNHSNWINTWTNLPNFSSSNPNQPCNMICNKLQIWDNNCQNAGPVQANQLACKIEEGNNQSQIHGCNC